MSRKSVLFKVVVLGESGVGKTSLLVRYVENKFTISTKSTIGSDFLSKEIDVEGRPVSLQIWDTAGQERFQGLGTSFYRGADAVIFVFDVTRKKTFDELSAWKKAFLIQIGQENNKEFPMIILANKVDLDDRQVSKRDIAEWANQNGDVHFYETSAKENVNVGKAFDEIAKLALAKVKEDDMNYSTVDLNVQKKNNGGCC
ncbi:ras-related protein Rab-7a-like [Planoprotostelium fungivorum]|uniref:Ras-related protein Rab-7b n=1 Tax=Planoprotostelium fungivorum TaxID=1890364 RepID=A0A2P6MTT4_9EUKA|nr:ras-related protein Rab-7a-like [Planoprotostelium fungivorum]